MKLTRFTKISYFILCLIFTKQLSALNYIHHISPKTAVNHNYPANNNKPFIIPNTWIAKVTYNFLPSILTHLNQIHSFDTVNNSILPEFPSPKNVKIKFKVDVIDSSMGLISIKMLGVGITFWAENKTVFTQYISNLKGVEILQYSHALYQRSTPNDPLFNRQYYLSQISADKIWTYSSRAISKKGDTLVVAVIDDGYDTSHPDLKSNLFINRQEIPWNGIDDDGNSYIDDYQGWNSGDQNPLIFNEVSVFDGHGTAVSGVIGAAGNNGIGISGVAWTIKILPINCWPKDMSDVELGLIRGMVYAYRMKQLYIKSSGKLGANIVAVNQSMGMDNGYPEDAPIWCQLFDSLGSVGILSAAATTNRNIKIENFGDLPTMCPSKHLITVSASNKDDQHYISGHSTEYVDLAAPGVQIYTTQPMEFNSADPYVSEAGTSFSSPQVAAAISLMHSLACDSFYKLYLNDPLEAHRLLINWLDSSVSKNSNLKQYTRTGGRLDIWQWYEQMRMWCKQVDSTFVGSHDLETSQLKVFPNPVKDNLMFIRCLSKTPIVDLHFEIFDFSGRVLDFWDSKASEFENSIYRKNISLKPGSYILHVVGRNSGQSQSTVFIVD